MGEGAFGTVVVKNVAGTEFVAKSIRRDKRTPEELEEIICEVAISKVCAMFEIAPDIETSIPYDLIVYEDAVQFHLEMCESVCVRGDTFSHAVQRDSHNFETDLIRCLRVLHSLNIVHRDIKPSNILYCPRLERYVLCDFGIARYVSQSIGEVSSTYCCGTSRFMGPEMRLLERSK